MPETTQELGPLPPYLYGRECSENERVWSEEAVRAYALQERAAERERCAKLCEAIEDQAYGLWRALADPTEQGRSLGAQHCADAIRSEST